MRRRDDSGAVALFVAITATLLLVMASLGTDLGMQRVVRRDLQALADVVALDLARELDGRTQAELAPEIDATDPNSALSRSVARNSNVLGDPPTVTATLGSWDGVTFDPTTDPPTAVKVVATGAVDFVIVSGTGTAQRTAIGSTLNTACFQLGSYAARFRSGDSALIASLDSPMDDLLRPQGSVTAADYTGLASAYLSIEDIAGETDVGSPGALMTASLTVRELITATIAALQKQSPANATAISVLNQVLNGHASIDTPIVLTKVVSISPTDEAALQTDLSVMDLVTGMILAADGSHGVTLGNGNLGTQIAGVASLTSANLTVTESPQVACGATGSAAAEAKTSQLSGTIQAKMQLPTINLGQGDIVQTQPATVTLTVGLGNATGDLTGDPVCGSGTAEDPDTFSVTVHSGLATLSLGTTLTFKTTLDAGAGVKIVTTWSQAASASTTMPAADTVAALQVPPNDTTPVSTGSGDVALPDVVVSSTPTNVTATLKSTGATVPVATYGPLLNPVALALSTHVDVDGRLDTLATNINSYLSSTVTLLGLNISGADVFAAGRPVCGAPVLRG